MPAVLIGLGSFIPDQSPAPSIALGLAAQMRGPREGIGSVQHAAAVLLLLHVLAAAHVTEAAAALKEVLADLVDLLDLDGRGRWMG